MKKSYTGFRNGGLFCFNCGRSQSMPFPMDIRLVGDFMKSFDKIHSSCEKTWKEPVPNPDITNSNAAIFKNLNWWIENAEHGISSKTMARYLSGNHALFNKKEDGHPSDISDFGRCYKLLEAVPQWKSTEELNKMKMVSKQWVNLIDNWRQLTMMYEELLTKNEDNGMYNFMQSLIK